MPPKIECPECSETFTPTEKYPGPTCRICTQMEKELQQEKRFLQAGRLMREEGVTLQEALSRIPQTSRPATD